MQVKVVNDADGCPAVTIIDDAGDTIGSVELEHSQEVTINVTGSVNGIAGTPVPSGNDEKKTTA